MSARAATLATVSRAPAPSTQRGARRTCAHATPPRRRHRAQPRLGESQEARRLSAEAIGRQLGGRLTIQVEAEGVREGEPTARGPGGELDAPRPEQTVEREQREGEEVTHRAQSEQSPSG